MGDTHHPVASVAIHGGKRFGVSTSLRDDLKARFPAETEAIDGYFEAVEEEQKYAGPYFAGMLLSCLLPKSFGKWLWSVMGSRHVKISNQTVASVLDRLTDNHDLRGLLTYHYGNYGLPPSEASFAIHGMVNTVLGLRPILLFVGHPASSQEFTCRLQITTLMAPRTLSVDVQRLLGHWCPLSRRPGATSWFVRGWKRW